MESLISNGIKVNVITKYEPEAGLNYKPLAFFFSYHITIENKNPFDVQLLRRHWQIFDSSGVHRVVNGEGVVGVQPVIPPGSYFEYASFCNLTTDIGRMMGIYEMLNIEDGSSFDVIIPTFDLIATERLN